MRSRKISEKCHIFLEIFDKVGKLFDSFSQKELK